MLPILGKNVQLTAKWWAEEVSYFLNSPRKRDTQPQNQDGNAVSRTRLQCYEKYFSDLCRRKGIHEDAVTSKWSEIQAFLSDKSNLIGSKIMEEDWRARFNGDPEGSDIKVAVVDTFKKIYGEVINNFGYEVILRLKIRTCPYCNRNYTFTVRKRKRRNSGINKFCTRPEFDHFFSKSDNPFFAVTFFNLVPSCKECNHGKGKKEARVNPYFGCIQAKFRLMWDKHRRERDQRENGLKKDYTLNKNEIYGLKKEGHFEIDFDDPDDAERRNIETFGLKEQYNHHKDYVLEIVEKAAAYNVLAREGIVDRFQGLFHNEAEVYNLIFGKYISDAEQPKRPLSKLTADILDQLGIRPTP